MADSDIVVSALATAAGISYNALTYATDDPHEGGLLNQSLDVVEVWASQTNNRTTATKVAEGNKTNALHVALGNGETWYYWIKGRNKQGYYGEWYPLSSTAGVVGTTAVITASEEGVTPAAWTSYTPTITAETGSITAYTLLSAKYVVIGKTCHAMVQFQITNNGTGAQGIFVTLPINASENGFVGAGSRNSDANMISAFVFDETKVSLRLYNGTYPGGAPEVIEFSVSYETA